MVGGVHIYSHLVVMEIILTWLWQFVFVGLFILGGYILNGRRNQRVGHEGQRDEDRLFPGQVELFRQRKRKRLLLFRRRYGSHMY